MESYGFDHPIEGKYLPSNMIHAIKVMLDPSGKVHKGILLCQGRVRTIDSKRWTIRTSVFHSNQRGYEYPETYCSKCMSKMGL